VGQKDVKENKTKSTAVQLEKETVPLHPELQAKLDLYKKQRAFNPDDWIQKKCAMFNDYMRKHGLKAALVSVSGGVDSAVTLALMKRAMEENGSPIERILGVAQPIHSSDWALNRAREVAAACDAPLIVIDQTKNHTQLTAQIDSSLGIRGGPFATGQMRSYMRAPVGYYCAQLLSQAGTPCVVMGTGNQDEDGYLAYFCKAGDGVVDIQLIADLHKSEVFAVGRAIKLVPESILVAAPSADLWDGQTDEEELGFTYAFVELLTGYYHRLSESEQIGFCESLGPEALAQFTKWRKAAELVHERNKHKLNGPINLNILK